VTPDDSSDELRLAQAEASQLRETITALRRELERQEIAFDKEKADLLRTHREELEQLHETIRLLRERLEGTPS
jgi:hypothetical protein